MVDVRERAARLFRTSVAVLVAGIVWLVLGLGAVFTSIHCLAKGGWVPSNVIGVLLAVFLGPLYWPFYAWSRCAP